MSTKEDEFFVAGNFNYNFVWHAVPVETEHIMVKDLRFVCPQEKKFSSIRKCNRLGAPLCSLRVSTARCLIETGFSVQTNCMQLMATIVHLNVCIFPL